MNINKGNWGKYVWFTSLSILAAVANMGVLYTINLIIKDYMTGAPVPSGRYLYLFAASVSGFVIFRWVMAMGIIKFTQRLLMRTRMDILKMVLRSPFSVLLNNRNQVITALTSDTGNVVNASINLVDIMTNVIVVLICFCYMGVLSWKLLLSMFGLICFTIGIYALSERRSRRFFKSAMEQNDVFVRYLNEILGGFKEICIAPGKGKTITDRHMDPAIRQGCDLNQRAQLGFLNNRIIGGVSFYLFIGLVMLFLGRIFGVSHSTLVNFIFLVLYTWGPMETIVLLIPNLSQARASLRRISSLEDQIHTSDEEGDQPIEVTPFEELELKDICFAYTPVREGDEDPAFTIGPIDLRIKKGEAVFICGDNGSGKTTLINILIGLTQRSSGSIRVNGDPILPKHLKSYKSLFAPVFSDFYLFDQFYDIPEIDPCKADAFLRLFGIDHKVKIGQDGFSDIDLSTGQRKRLALIYAMLEKKPILVLDEFAADQDPYFKRKFYKEIIGYLKNEGFTLIAITHDDNYYHYADRLFKMDSGKISEIKLKSRSGVNVFDLT
jgi:putative ATP-binding cassette transporter